MAARPAAAAWRPRGGRVAGARCRLAGASFLQVQRAAAAAAGTAGDQLDLAHDRCALVDGPQRSHCSRDTMQPLRFGVSLGAQRRAPEIRPDTRAALAGALKAPAFAELLH